MLSEAIAEINRTEVQLGMPSTIHGVPQGTAKAFQDSLNNQALLFLAALAAVYIVLGILYESFIHPITILSTLPSAGVGAVLALMLFGSDFTIIALIGVILLIGIVKKNAIMMIDFALEAERAQGLSPRDRSSSMHAAVSPDHDDDLRGDSRRRSARPELRRGRRNPPPARHSDRRRIDRQPASRCIRPLFFIFTWMNSVFSPKRAGGACFPASQRQRTARFDPPLALAHS